MSADYATNPAVNTLRDYLRIRSVHPNVNYDECLTFLRGQAAAIGLPVQVFEVVPKKPVLVMTWEGLQPDLPSILLNSHMDVVPVFEKSWSHPPFAAEIVDGVIYGRGVQDMKSVAVQYLETVRRLKNKGIRLKRTVHLSFVPDEEVGGAKGMAEFVKTDHYKNLRVGFALDEGIACATEEYQVFNGERTIWHLNVVCPGKSGHGSLLLPDTCGEKVRISDGVLEGEVTNNGHKGKIYSFRGIPYAQPPLGDLRFKIRYIIDKFMDLRQVSKTLLESDPSLTIGDVTSINLTMISGGIQDNIVPEKMTAHLDIRLATSEDLEAFENMIKQWCAEAGAGVTYSFNQKDPYVPPTVVNNSNPYWVAFKAAADKLGIKIVVRTFPGGTDSRFIRATGTPALGLTPAHLTPSSLHEHDENLPVVQFLRGIQIYEEILPAVANI